MTALVEYPLAYATPLDAPRWKRWMLYSPGARLIIFAAVFLLLMFALQFSLHALAWSPKHAPAWERAAIGLLFEAGPTLLAYVFVVQSIERRYPRELAPEALPRLLLAGLAGGAVLFSAVVGVLWLAGSYHLVGGNAHPDWLPQLAVVGFGAGIGEEILMRGALLRMVEEGLGTWIALAISAALFGAGHLGNPNATWWAAAAIAIEAGLMLGMLYHLTRSLWPCIGLHAAWNIMQGLVYGIPVSGTHADGFLVSTRSGPDWLSGGAFGAEASVVALALCSVCTIVMIVIAVRRGSIVPPYWARKPAPTGDWDRLTRID